MGRRQVGLLATTLLIAGCAGWRTRAAHPSEESAEPANAARIFEDGSIRTATREQANQFAAQRLWIKPDVHVVSQTVDEHTSGGVSVRHISQQLSDGASLQRTETEE